MDDGPELDDIHINLYSYQLDWLDEEGYDVSKVVRRKIDEKIRESGEDPGLVREDYQAHSG